MLIQRNLVANLVAEVSNDRTARRPRGGRRGPAVITDWTLVTAVVDRIVPEDEYPSASQAGIVDQLAADASSHLSTLWATSLAPAPIWRLMTSGVVVRR